ncbi:MAG: glycosyltransferase A (GT-A) superfamily protein (DUF2064 family) [Bacteriovoracaceae bacterium]|jgi:glycosyltransferase A (GT-A) superfamily protein (DUF2064 family)
MKQVFAVIGKRPVEGYSKTRLAAEVGEEEAYDLYNSFIDDFFSNFKKHTAKASLFFYGAPAISQTEDYFKQMFLKCQILDFQFYFQKEKPFFERLSDIFEDVRFRVGGETFVHLTGTDIPDFPFSHIKKQNIDEADVFIGPDTDGGFYYLGSKAKNDEIFGFISEKKEDESVVEALISRCRNLNLTVKVLNEWSDIDTREDLETTLSRSPKEVLPLTSERYSRLLKDKDW